MNNVLALQQLEQQPGDCGEWSTMSGVCHTLSDADIDIAQP